MGTPQAPAVDTAPTRPRESVWDRFRQFLNPFDVRYEDLNRSNWARIVIRDTSAGLIVAMMAIPLAMGFAMASGLRPEHGILAGAIAGLVGALFGGSKYNVYGPVAALIPVIAAIMATYRTPDDPYAGHGYLVLICLCSGPILMACALFGWGRIGNLVPHSIVVGFSIGIAVTIALTQFGEILGLKTAITGGFANKVRLLWENIGQANGSAMFLGLVTFILIRSLLNISIYIPAPLLAIGVGTALAATIMADDDLSLVKTKYGEIPTDFLQVTPPTIPAWDASLVAELAYYAFAFAFVCGFESILAARMADRLADNRGTPYNPNREFWGQGLIQTFVPMLNGMPLSGALARTATNIKLGAVTPLAGIMKCVLKLLLAYFLARDLELVPMACIGGILLWVAVNMVKPKEIKQVWAHNWFHTGLMAYTAVMVIAADFLTGVLSAMAIYLVLFKVLDKPATPKVPAEPRPAAEPTPAVAAAPVVGERILVGLTRPEVDRELVAYASLAARLGPAREVRFTRLLPSAADRDSDQVRSDLRAAVRPHFTGVPNPPPVSYDALGLPLMDRLLEHVADQQIDLILVGERRGPADRNAFARRLAMKAPSSVWLVPDGAPATIRRVLVPIDFSEPAADSLRVAAAIARRAGAECLALHVYFNEATVTYEEYDQVIRGQEREAFERFVAPIDLQGVQVTPLFEEGANVAHAITRVGERHGADLIVMSTRGRSRSAAVLLGSVTEEMIVKTPVPLLAVKHFGTRMGVLQALLGKKFWHQGELHT
ncbi:MAG TPA: SulP family inorganic anion transporter [Gemmataceae bacterium]|nr:SulP family inorganic anion transporter [Gemmataceae bacterium]